MTAQADDVTLHGGKFELFVPQFEQYNKKNCIAEGPARVFLFASACAHSSMN